MATQEAVGTPVEGGDRGSSSALTGRHRKQKRKVRRTQQLVRRLSHLKEPRSTFPHSLFATSSYMVEKYGFVAEADGIVHHSTTTMTKIVVVIQYKSTV